MWKHIFAYGNTRFCLCQDTGTMNRTPTPGGLFVAHFTVCFVGISVCSLGVCGLFATHSRYEYGILGWYAKPKPLREL